VGERARRRLRRGLVAAVWCGALYYVVFGGEYSWSDLRALERDEAVAAARLDSLRAEADSVSRRADSLATDPFAIERTARERYGFLRKGEHLYRFVGRDKGPSKVDRSDGGG
jgi:cell division protein FtsB